MTSVDLGRYKNRIVQYFWDPEPKNDDMSHSPIWCLGREYATPASPNGTSVDETSHNQDSAHLAQESSLRESSVADDSIINSFEHVPGPDETSQPTDPDKPWPAPFLDDFESRLWLTYRSNFEPIPKSQSPNAAAAMTFSARIRSQLVDQAGFTSDTGWGCMIRSGQSLLANTLIMLRLGRDWRRGTRVMDERRVVSMFADDPRAPFSIHRFVGHGASACGKHPGEWFGPSATAQCIQSLSNNTEAAGLRVYITGDGADVYEDRFMKMAKPTGNVFRPTLVLVGIRLGIDRVTPVYWESLKASLRMPQSVGIAGGRPSASHYFVGVQGSHFFYLDPHQTRPALPLHDDPRDYSQEDIDSYHTRRLRRINITEMDPSMLIGFLIRDENDWVKWRQQVSQAPGKAVIHVADTAPALLGHGPERAGALDEVEVLDDDEDEDDDDDDDFNQATAGETG